MLKNVKAIAQDGKMEARCLDQTYLGNVYQVTANKRLSPIFNWHKTNTCMHNIQIALVSNYSLLKELNKKVSY